MRAARLAMLGVLVWSGCSGTAPTNPSTNSPPTAAVFTISGMVYEIDAAGRRPLAAATVEIADSTTAAWGQYGRPTTDPTGRYVTGPLTARHYLARASKSGYIVSAVVSLGYLEGSRTLDFELVTPFATTAPLSIASLSPTRGTSGGGTTIRITGAGFQSRATVAFDGVAATAYAENSSVIHASTPVHSPGSVDVLVTNPDGQVSRLAGGYTYAPPSSFDFNGTWVGYALAHPESGSRLNISHSDMDFRLTIENNTVISVNCGGTAIALPSPPPSVTNGEFAVDGTSMSGRILSAVEAGGPINTTACPSTRWIATKQ